MCRPLPVSLLPSLVAIVGLIEQFRLEGVVVLPIAFPTTLFPRPLLRAGDGVATPFPTLFGCA